MLRQWGTLSLLATVKALLAGFMGGIRFGTHCVILPLPNSPPGGGGTHMAGRKGPRGWEQRKEEKMSVVLTFLARKMRKISLQNDAF